MRSLITVVVAFFGLAGCHKQLNPGRCNSTSDCLTGQTCDLTQNGVCVCNSPECADGGGTGGAATGGTGGAVASGGAAGTTTDDGGIDSSDAPHGCQSRSDCSAPTPACGSTGACVQCSVSTVVMDCLDPTKPICDAATNTCVACASDDQCAQRNGANPGVCMSHQDGHCAMPAETIYVVDDTSVCVTTVATGDPGAGTVTKPLCTMDPVPMLLSTSRSLVLVRGTVQVATNWTFAGQAGEELSIIGQQTALVASATSPGFSIQGGEAYIRNTEFSSSGSTCVSASGGTLRLETTIVGPCKKSGISATGGTLVLNGVTVSGCMGGGILLNGAAFDIENATIENNGPGQQGTASWGGILENAAPASGSARLNLVTIENNMSVGLGCIGALMGTGVLASGNSGGVDIQPTCMVTGCSPMGATCGAQ
jgi:hypothetical protein